jgi:hypothetical protein
MTIKDIPTITLGNFEFPIRPLARDVESDRPIRVFYGAESRAISESKLVYKPRGLYETVVEIKGNRGGRIYTGDNVNQLKIEVVSSGRFRDKLLRRRIMNI